MASGGANGVKRDFCNKTKEFQPVVASGGATGGNLVVCSNTKEYNQWWQTVAPPVASSSFAGIENAKRKDKAKWKDTARGGKGRGAGEAKN